LLKFHFPSLGFSFLPSPNTSCISKLTTRSVLEKKYNSVYLKKD
jgi:hypothetical protein